MKKYFALFILCVLVANTAFAQEKQTVEEKKAAIEVTARNYIEGWFTGDAERMDRALHTDLIKRGIFTNKDGSTRMNQLVKDDMVKYTKQGSGKKPKDQWGIKIEINDVFEKTSMVKVVSADFIDYLQIANFDGKWQIINVLWEMKKK